MNDCNSGIEISFRFLRLNKLQAFTLEREILGASYRANKTGSNYIGSVALTKQNIDDINDFYVRQRIEIDDCDIFVAVISGTKIYQIEVPAIANRMLKYIDCKITVCFAAQ